MNTQFTIVNVVATAALDQPMDLELLRERFPKNILYDQDIYGGRVAYFKTKNMEGKVSIFWSGKLISVGTKSVEKAKQELQLTAKTLKTNLKTKPKIQNIVATTTLQGPIEIENIIKKSQKHFSIIYEPEQFPGAIITLTLPGKSKATILLFSSGKVVCVGLKDPKNIAVAINRLLEIIS